MHTTRTGSNKQTAPCCVWSLMAPRGICSRLISIAGRSFSLYEANLHLSDSVSVEVVVKFLRFQYWKDAHKCLADQQLALKLYSCELLDGRWYAIVMEKVVGECI